MKINKTGKIVIASVIGLGLILIATKVARGKGSKLSSNTSGDSESNSTSNSTTIVTGSGDTFPLARGSSGGNVTVLQKKINNKIAAAPLLPLSDKSMLVTQLTSVGMTINDFPIDEDGKFGGITEKVVKAFTGKTSIDETGLAKL